MTHPPVDTAPHVLRAEGSWREIGQAYGEQFREELRVARSAVYDLTAALEITPSSVEERVGAFIPWARESTPDRWNEMTGVAEGCGLSVEDVLLMHLLEDLFEVDACTSGAADGVLAHAEMWFAGQSEYAVLVASPTNGPPTVTVSCVGFLTGVGLNASGFAVGVQSTSSTDARVGVPRALISRQVLCAPSADEALKITGTAHRSGGNGFVLVTPTSTRVIETSATRRHVSEDLPYAVHTNHYTSQTMQPVATRAGESAVRHREAARSVAAHRGSLDIVRAQQIVGSRGFRTASADANVVTVFVVVADTRAQTVSVAGGNGDSGHWTTVGLP